MKMKYTAAFALVAWLLVTGWLASMVVAKPAVLRLGNQAEETAEMAELRTAIGRNAQIAGVIASLRGDNPLLPITSAAGTELIALPSATAPASTAAAGTGAAAAAANASGDAGTGPVTHVVSLVLVANGRRTAVIDGQYVRAGTRLADGTRVNAIGADWVRLSDPSGAAQTYRVTNPMLQATQAGGRP